MVRVDTAPGAPAAYECLGSFTKSSDGTWGSTIHASADIVPNCSRLRVAHATRRVDAICQLWLQRHRALRQVV